MTTFSLEILKCLCSPRCKLLAVSLNNTRLTPMKHSGKWEILETCEVKGKTVREAIAESDEESP
jgi:hypothetical protein